MSSCCALIASIAMLQSGLPSIPSGIKDQGLLAVLFMVLLGVVAGIYGLSKGYIRIGPSEVRFIEAVDKLVAVQESVLREVEAMRNHYHKSLVPSISGMAVAYLILVKQPELAARLKKDIEEAGGEIKMP